MRGANLFSNYYPIYCRRIKCFPKHFSRIVIEELNVKSNSGFLQSEGVTSFAGQTKKQS